MTHTIPQQRWADVREIGIKFETDGSDGDITEQTIDDTEV